MRRSRLAIAQPWQPTWPICPTEAKKPSPSRKQGRCAWPLTGDLPYAPRAGEFVARFSPTAPILWNALATLLVPGAAVLGLVPPALKRETLDTRRVDPALGLVSHNKTIVLDSEMRLVEAWRGRRVAMALLASVQRPLHHFLVVTALAVACNPYA